MELLRFFTAGNVDDGKSTLIGRLLFDSDSISTDIIETLTKQSKTTGEDTGIDLALLTDGLRAEREQGITIDVAYKYFTTEKRKFIIADTPGHAQYTRNMFTGASNTDLAIILIDARNGITDQTKRHSIISGILGIPHVLICVNKMDLVNYSEERYLEIIDEYEAFASKIGLKKTSYIPVSALSGDNVVKSSQNLAWYKGRPLFEFLENVQIQHEEEVQAARFQVQYVIRPQTTELHDYRGYAGSLLSGNLKVGQEVLVYPLETRTKIARIEKNSQDVQEAKAGEPIILHLADDLDVSRGSIILPIDENSEFDQTLEATICWMDNKPFQKGQKLVLQQSSFTTKAVIKDLESKIDIHSFENIQTEEDLVLNEFANITLKTADALSYDAYRQNRKTGAFILVNENSNQTVAAGIFN